MRVFVVALVVVLTVGSVVRAENASPVPAWNAELGRLEGVLRQLPAGDVPARDRLAADIARLRKDVETFLLTFAPAIDARPPWLEPAGAVVSVESLAAEIGRLRASVSRVEQSLRAGGDGAFYLGRVDVEVTASATASATTELAPVGAAVIGAEELRAHNKVALADALALAPGVSVSRVGQRNEQSIYVRGFDVRQVPLFIDGVPIYTPYDGYADLGRFTTFDVAELRVSKGFSSVLYGANALGGAINVVSRRPTGRIEGLAGVGAASGPSKNAYANVGTRFNRWYAQGGASYLQADTFPLSKDFVAVKTEDGGDRQNAFSKDVKFNVKLGVTARDSDEYAVSYVAQRGEKGNPPYAGTDPAVRVRYWKWPSWDKDSVYLVTHTSLGKAGYLRGRGFYDIYDNALYAYDDATFATQAKSSSFKSLYHDTTIGGSVEWGSAIGGHQMLRAAFHLKNDYHQEHNVGDPVQKKEGRIISVGVEDSLTLSPRLSVVAGISSDWQTTAKAENLEGGKIVNLPMGNTNGVNPQLGVFFGIPSGMLRATVSHKTRLPSLKDRYSFRLGTAIPNPALEPERATTAETGYQGALGARTTVSASVFYSRITDLIQRFSVQPNISQQRNIGKASSAGAELDVRSRVTRWLDLSANYSYLDRDNLSDSTVPLTETPVHKGRVSVSIEPARMVRLSANVEYESGRQTLNESGKLLDVPDVATVSAKATYAVGFGVDVDLSVTNLFDSNIWIADGYPEAGRTFVAGLRYRF